MNLAMDVEDDETRRMPPTPYLPRELIVSEILVRLPVESLLRFRCVCKAWHDTVSGDTSFSQAHVRRLHRQRRRTSSLLIAPYITIVVDDDVEFANPGLYLWEENQRQDGVATLVDDMASFQAAAWTQMRHGFAHCDGLVMLPGTEGTVRVLNPATRRSVTLPWSPNSTGHERLVFEGPNAYGFGRHPSSGAYKVARFFRHHPVHPLSVVTPILGMEVFTIGEDRCWRETAAKPPYRFIAGRTATFIKGSLIWTVDLRLYTYYSESCCFVCFNLEDESFTVMAAPRWYPEPDYEKSRLAELHGELALTRLNEESIEIWMCQDIDDVNPPRWARRHVVNFQSSIHLIAALDNGIVFCDRSYHLCRRTSEGSKHMVDMKTLKYRNPDTDTLVGYPSVTFADFDVIPYIPTLVPI